MTKLLTTGEMIDELKVGRKAESVDGHVVKRLAHGEIISIRDNSYRSAVVLTEPFLKTKWRILPSYVSFEKAMQALKEGKMVKLHRNNNLDVTVFRKWYKLESREDVTFDDLFNGKWTIEED